MGILQARILAWVAMPSSRGIFPIQGLNPGLPHCRWIPYQSEPLGKPKNTGVGSLALLQGIFLIQESNQSLPHYRQILYQLSYQGGQLSEEDIRDVGSIPGSGRSPGGRHGNPQVFLPGESHGKRSLEDCSP